MVAPVVKAHNLGSYLGLFQDGMLSIILSFGNSNFIFYHIISGQIYLPSKIDFRVKFPFYFCHMMQNGCEICEDG